MSACENSVAALSVFDAAAVEGIFIAPALPLAASAARAQGRGTACACSGVAVLPVPMAHTGS